MGQGQSVLVVVLVIAVWVGLFFLIRDLMCWYWKINALLDEQKQTNALLRLMVQSQGIQEPAQRQAVTLAGTSPVEPESSDPGDDSFAGWK